MFNISSLEDSLLVICGPTASGKTSFAINNLKSSKEIVIINADSSQIYKEAPVLSNIPSEKEQSLILHKLFAVTSVFNEFSIHDWIELVQIEVQRCLQKNQQPVIVGGTGFYINAINDGLPNIPSDIETKKKVLNTYNNMGYEKFFTMVSKIDPKYTNKNIDPYRLMRLYEVYLISNKNMSFWIDQPKRKIISSKVQNIYLSASKEALLPKVAKRTKYMLTNGAIEEITNLANKNTKALKKFLGAQQIYAYLKGDISYEELILLINTKTLQYAKRQRTWFNNKLYKTHSNVTKIDI